jgi:hypothetical protein
MPEAATTARQIVNLNSSAFRGIISGKYFLVINTFSSQEINVLHCS